MSEPERGTLGQRYPAGSRSPATRFTRLGLVVVYAMCMSRTNIDLDDELVARAMRRFGLRTKREAVDLALRRLAGPPLHAADLAAMEGIGWDGDLSELRDSRDVGW